NCPASHSIYTPLTFGSLNINTPAFDARISQQAKVIYYPAIHHAFNGTGPAMLTVTQKDSAVGGGMKLTGQFSVDNDQSSTLVKALASKNAPLSLGKYISFDAAAFALFRLPPMRQFPETLVDTSSVDSFFIDHTAIYKQIGNTLEDELAMIMFAKSGFRSINEHAFIRKLADPAQLSPLLKKLVE